MTCCHGSCCDKSQCYHCSPITKECEYKCDPNTQFCCIAKDDSQCCNAGQQCCTYYYAGYDKYVPYCCNSDQDCCNWLCCDPNKCETCVDGSCLPCGGDTNKICCSDANSPYCCDPNHECCNGTCCEPNEFCCNGNCCPDHKCCVDGVCIRCCCGPMWETTVLIECSCSDHTCSGIRKKEWHWHCAEGGIYGDDCPDGTECVQTGWNVCYKYITYPCKEGACESGSECGAGPAIEIKKAPRVLCGCCPPG